MEKGRGKEGGGGRENIEEEGKEGKVEGTEKGCKLKMVEKKNGESVDERRRVRE